MTDLQLQSRLSRRKRNAAFISSTHTMMHRNVPLQCWIPQQQQLDKNAVSESSEALHKHKWLQDPQQSPPPLAGYDRLLTNKHA